MSDFITRLASLSLSPEVGVMPRLPSRFETERTGDFGTVNDDRPSSAEDPPPPAVAAPRPVTDDQPRRGAGAKPETVHSLTIDWSTSLTHKAMAEASASSIAPSFPRPSSVTVDDTAPASSSRPPDGVDETRPETGDEATALPPRTPRASRITRAAPVHPVEDPSGETREPRSPGRLAPEMPETAGETAAVRRRPAHHPAVGVRTATQTERVSAQTGARVRERIVAPDSRRPLSRSEEKALRPAAPATSLTDLRAPIPHRVLTPDASVLARLRAALRPGPGEPQDRLERSDAPPPAPIIHVHIGRVEVRATPPPARPARQPRPAVALQTLDDYLRRRNGGTP